MPRFRHRLLVPILLTALLAPGVVKAQGDEDGVFPPPESLQIFPYQYVNFTQSGHDYRLWNSRAVILGEIISMRTIEGTEKLLDRSVTLRIESFLLMDQPEQQEGLKEISFRTLPLQAPYEDMQVGDRCLVLLTRDREHDSALILPTDYNYYPVTADGLVRKFFKEVPTKNDPVIREVGLSEFLRDIKNKLRLVSIEEQAKNAELLVTGVVKETRQGKGPVGDYFIAEIAVEKVLKGSLDKDLVTIYTLSNMERWTLATLNGPVYRVGQKVFAFANKDPTLSAPSPDNPDGEPRWTLLNGRQSIWDVHPRTVWRRGARAIKTDEFFQIIEENIAR